MAVAWIGSSFTRWVRFSRLLFKDFILSWNDTVSKVKSLPLRSIALVGVACVAMLGYQGWREWVARSVQVNETQTSVLNLASSLTQHADGMIAVADTAVIGLVERLETDGRSPKVLAQIDRKLMAQIAAGAYYRAIIVLDADGNWLATSMTTKGKNVSDREYFRHHRDNPSRGLFVGPPIKSRVLGDWVITVSRRLQSADGAFAGVVLALIDLSDFVDHYATYDLGPNSSISLLATDGTLLARYPSIEERIGQDISNAAVFNKLRERPVGSYLTTAFIDGLRRFVGYRRSDRYPLVVTAAIWEDEALGAWRADMGVHMLMTFVLTGAVGLLGLYLIWQMRRSQTAEERVRESEARLRESNERVLLATDSGAIGLWEWNATPGAMIWNSWMYRLFGMQNLDEIPTYAIWKRHLHPEDCAAAEQAVRVGIAGTNSYTNEYRVIWDDGTIHYLRSAGQVTRDAVGDTVRVIGSTWDVTERRRLADEQIQAERRDRQALEAANADLDRVSKHLAQARDKADQANRAKSRFLAGMSHELRTPLNGVLGYAQLLHMEGGLNAKQGARVDAMVGAGKHLLEMITCVLDLSEIEAEHVELHAVEFDVQSVAEACLDLIRPTAEGKGLSLNLAMAPGTRRSLTADPTRLRQVLLNLLGNASKFTSEGSIELRLRSAEEGSILRIEVVDNGPGIPADQRARLFNDFERLDNEATRTAEGSGLGLALSSRLATLMGGRLGHDDNPGGGSVFWLELPQTTPAKSHSVSTHLSAGWDAHLPLSPARPLHVLVVDDVLMNRDICESFLRAAGHEVTSAEGGAEGVAAAASTDFDVVVMDVRMPEMDGLEATRRIRTLEGARGKVPIVALTAHAFSEQVRDCRKAGMDSHLAKPFEMETLLAAIAEALAERQQPYDEPGPAGQPNTQLADLRSTSIDAEPPILNHGKFERTTSLLNPEAVATYLRTLAQRGETLQRGLREPDAITRIGAELAKGAHMLVGSAGMFGFDRIAAKGRSFERAIQSGAADAPAFADELCTAVDATLEEIRSHLCETAL